GRAAPAAHAQVRVDLDVIAVGRDRSSRAHVDALVAADLRGAAVRADLLVVGEEPRLLELADHLRKLCRRECLLERIVTGREIALRRPGCPAPRIPPQADHHVEALAPPPLPPPPIDASARAPPLHA